jgi:hypothetical protein
LAVSESQRRRYRDESVDGERHEFCTGRIALSKLGTLSRVGRTLFQDPRKLRRVLDAEQETRDYVSRKYRLATGLPQVNILDLLPTLDETVAPYSVLEGTSPTIDIALLKGLARRFPDCRYFEIGAWRGESLANVATVAEHCVSLSLSDDEMRSRGLSEDFIRNSRFFCTDLPNVRFEGHDSLTFDYSPHRGKFDLVFVDGDHAYASVRTDTANAFELIKDSGSVIVWHDYGLTPETVRWSVLAGILDGSPEKHRGNLYHVSNTMCAIYTAESFSARYSEFPQLPDKRFAVRITATRC